MNELAGVVGWPQMMALAAIGLVVLGVVVARRRWHVRRHAGGGNLVHIAAPPEVDTRGAEQLWLNLAGIAAPGFKRAIWGQSHVVFEYAWTERRLDIRMWTPPRVPVALVRAAITAVWPGATTTVSEADGPIPRDAWSRGGAMNFRGGDASPLAQSPGRDVEPLRALLSAADAGARGEYAVVQVLARPAPRRRLTRLHHQAGHAPGTSLAGMLLDLVGPAGHRASVSHSRRNGTPAAIARHSTTMFEVAVRYAVAITKDGAP